MRKDSHRRSRSHSTMRKDGVKHPTHPSLAEDKNKKELFHPGRSGGSYDLPMGGKLQVPEGVCSKKDTILCRVIPPSHRWRFTPNFPGEHLTSEIFEFTGTFHIRQNKRGTSSRRGTGKRTSNTSSGHSGEHIDQCPSNSLDESKQKHLILILPYNSHLGSNIELNVKGMWKDEFTWVDVGFIPKDGEDGNNFVELQVDRLGTFAVTFRPKTDQCQMTPNGSLFHSRLHRNLVVRFPKKAVDTNINLNMKIEDIPEERVAFCREYFPQECMDLLIATEFIDLGPDVRCDFRRFATVKLPLPRGVEVEGETSEEIVVLQKELDEWQWVDTKYKFTRNTVSFDTKNPSKFCVVKTKPERQKKMQSAVTVLEERAMKEKGQVNVFISLLEKSWMGLVEVYPLSIAPAKINARVEQGFIPISKIEVVQEVTSKTSFSRRPPPPKEHKPKQLDCFELFDGLTWTVDLEDDLKFGPETDLCDNAELSVFKYLKESYRRFTLVPTGEELRALKGTLVVRPEGVVDPKQRELLTMAFSVDIPEEAVVNYFYVPEPEPEPEPARPRTFDLPTLPDEEEPRQESKTSLNKLRTFSIEAMERLTQSSRRPSVLTQPDKEAKVISGKSLMALSKVINEGLTLAVHLELPDSTITGIGFDALSNNRSMTEVGYRILLYWKRTLKDKKDAAVTQLVGALRNMGKNGVADVIEERHKENKELTTECFLMAAVSGISLQS